jgi:flagellar motor protein MotB
MQHRIIDQQNSSYKRGMILGLTMAEIMLLLVFCLLLMIGAVTEKLQSDLKTAREKIIAMSRLEKANKETTQLLQKLISSANSQNVPVDEYWMELVRAQELAQKLHEKGVKSEQLVSHVEKLLDAERMLKKYDIQKIDSLLSEQAAKSHDKPPHIVLSEADGFFFDSGRAEIKPQFLQRLKEIIVPQIVHAMNTYDVDIVEVIGHTDSEPVGPHISNLDSVFPSVIRGEVQIGGAHSSDNAGLGLMRAVAVVKALLEEPSTRNYRLLPFSAGQLIDTNEKLLIEAPNRGVDARRRIEIRLRKSSKERANSP